MVMWCDSVSDVELDVADDTGRGGEVAHSVEQCECPPNYVGSSCEQCADGYYRSKEGPYLGTCVPCQCHDRADTCNPYSGACVVSHMIYWFIVSLCNQR